MAKKDLKEWEGKKSIVLKTEPMRCSFANVHEARINPQGDMQYSICGMVDKDDKSEVARYKQAVQDAVAIGLANGVFGQSDVRRLKLPLRDGDEAYENEERGKEFQNHIFFNANTKNQPGIVGPDGRPSVGDVEVYSGCWVRLHMSVYPYNAINPKTGKSIRKGVAVGLNHVMFVKDDSRFDGRVAAEDAFKEFQSDDDTEQAAGNLV